MDFKKNELVTLSIEDIGADGEGIGKADGYTLFVKDAVIGDVVEARITKSKKNYGYARLEKVLTPSPFRVQPPCPFHRQCGGCQIQAMAYDRQLRFKEEKVKNHLQRIGGFSADELEQVMEPIVGMEEPFGYRNKAQYPIGMDKEGNPVAGFYAGRTHSIVANTDCLLGRAENRQILEVILAHMRSFHLAPYEEETGKGLLRHVLIRTGFHTGEIMVCLVINCEADQIRKRQQEGKAFLPGQEVLLEKLCAIHGMTSVSVNCNTEKSNVILGKEVFTIWGKDTITDTIRVRNMETTEMSFTGKELSFAISPLSFYQVSPLQTEKLYSLALQYAGLTGRETVWDLYCGIGTISLFMATAAKQVCGVEIVPQAIEDARENARRNRICNAAFFVGKAEEVLPDYYEGKLLPEWEAGGAFRHPDVIVVDPPRKGCDERCLETMLRMQPERIVYVSCDSATLARDLHILCDGGYRLRKVRPVDQFAQTVHVECVIMMQYCGKEKKK